MVYSDASQVFGELISGDGKKLLSEITGFLPEGLTVRTAQPHLNTLNAKLRSRGYAPDLIAAALTLTSLRIQGKAKFGEAAADMFFTRDGLEQATRGIIAERHAAAFVQAGAHAVADLGCGIGSDSRAFAQAGLGVEAVELDATTAAMATANLSSYPTARVRVADVTALDIDTLRADGVDALFVDPSRRTGAARGSQRIYDPEQWSPPLSQAISWAKTIGRVAIKVAPGIEHATLPPTWHAQWTSVDGELVEALLYSPAMGLPAGRSACVMRSAASGTVFSTLIDEGARGNCAARVAQAPVGVLGSMLTEPDPAVIRSGGIATLAEQFGAHLISGSIAYLTADSLPAAEWWTRFEVCSVVPLRMKAIKKALREFDPSSVEIKKRGASIDTGAMQRALASALSSDSDGGEMTVFATRLGDTHRAILTRRLDHAGNRTSH